MMINSSASILKRLMILVVMIMVLLIRQVIIMVVMIMAVMIMVVLIKQVMNKVARMSSTFFSSRPSLSLLST